jgi:hypothetical protein
MGRRGLAVILVLGAVCAAPASGNAAPWRAAPATTWATFKTLPNATAGGQPTLVGYNGTLWAFWPGTADPSPVFYSRLSGSTWSTPQEMPSALTVHGAGGVGAAVFGKKLVVAWVDFNAPAYRIRYAEFDGSQWAPEQTVPHSHGGESGMIKPGVHQFGNSLVFTWVGSANGPTFPHRAWYSTLTGSTWSAAARIPSSPDQKYPGLGAFGGELYVAITDEAEGHAEYSVYNGTTWSAPAIASPLILADANGKPVQFGTHLYLFYASLDNNAKISYSTMISAGNWTHTTIPSALTAGVPTAAATNGRVWVAWQAQHNFVPTTTIRYTSTTNP